MKKLLAVAVLALSGCALDLCPAGYYDVGGGNCCPNGYIYAAGSCWTAYDTANNQPAAGAVSVKPEPTQNTSK